VLKNWHHATEFGPDQDWTFANPLKIDRLPYSYTDVWRELKRVAAAGKGEGNVSASFA
jgi:hypothetical protein